MSGNMRIFALRPTSSGSIDVKIDGGKSESSGPGSHVSGIDDGLRLNKIQRDFLALYVTLHALRAARFREPGKSLRNADFLQPKFSLANSSAEESARTGIRENIPTFSRLKILRDRTSCDGNPVN